jgi:hypothetical protein
MQQATSTKGSITFKEFKVPTHKDDIITNPFMFFNKKDTTWATRAKIFYTRVLGGAIMEESKFMKYMECIR